MSVFWEVVGNTCYCPHTGDPPCGHPTHFLILCETVQIRDVGFSALDVVLALF